MWYEGLSVEELADLIRYESEAVVIKEAFLQEADVELLHGWTLEENWLYTEILSWGIGAVSSKTTKHQRVHPPLDWVPEVRPEPEPEPEEPTEEPPAEPDEPESANS